MASSSAGSFKGPKPANQGDYVLPAAGYSRTDTAQPGGTPTGSIKKNPDEKYKGVQVKPIGGSGTTVSKPKPFKRG